MSSGAEKNFRLNIMVLRACRGTTVHQGIPMVLYLLGHRQIIQLCKLLKFYSPVLTTDRLSHNMGARVGRAQLYRLSLVDAHTVAQNQYPGNKFDNIHFFVMALCTKV